MPCIFAVDFASGNAGRLWPFGQIFQTGAISGQVSTILALPSQDSSVRALSYARVISGGRSCPALSRVHTYDLRQMLSNQEAVVVVFKFRSDYFTSRAAPRAPDVPDIARECGWQLIRYSEYLKSMGILRRVANAIIVVDGKQTVATMLDISRILERLKPVNGQVVALIVNVSKESVFLEIGYHAKHSAFLGSFQGPVIGVVKGGFECDPLSW